MKTNQTKKLKIALDFDDTYTADPVLWKLFVDSCIARGHDVKFVTYRDGRYGNHDIEYASECLGIPIIYCAGKQKQHCYDADIWIDDDPSTIVNFEMLGKMYDGCLVNNDCKNIKE